MSIKSYFKFVPWQQIMSFCATLYAVIAIVAFLGLFPFANFLLALSSLFLPLFFVFAFIIIPIKEYRKTIRQSEETSGVIRKAREKGTTFDPKKFKKGVFRYDAPTLEHGLRKGIRTGADSNL